MTKLASLFAATLFFGGPTSASGLIDPPPEFDHPFAGQIILHHLPYRPLFGPISAAHRNALLDGWSGHPQCDIWLPDDDEVGAEGRARLFHIEQANCNGWAARDGDVNWRH